MFLGGKCGNRAGEQRLIILLLKPFNFRLFSSLTEPDVLQLRELCSAFSGV